MHRKSHMQKLSGTFLVERAHFTGMGVSKLEDDMKTALLIGSLVCTAVSGSSLLGQRQLPANHPLTEIKYRAAGKLIYVPVQINGSTRIGLYSTPARQTASSIPLWQKACTSTPSPAAFCTGLAKAMFRPTMRER
jgi:hypothetical protein